MTGGSRYLYVTGARRLGLDSPAWRSAGAPRRAPDGGPGADGETDGEWVAWRLLGRNNRELGRSPTVYPTVQACGEALDTVRSRASGASPVLVAEASTGAWGWRLEIDGRPIAVAARTYQRQRESTYNLAQFVLAAGEAQIIAHPAPRRRAGGVGAGVRSGVVPPSLLPWPPGSIR